MVSDTALEAELIYGEEVLIGGPICKYVRVCAIIHEEVKVYASFWGTMGPQLCNCQFYCKFLRGGQCPTMYIMCLIGNIFKSEC